ncbi:hypothetical protein [Roseobacter denitrificans]|uniref:Uncharacterized protein n=1 Tax=Roseobacter denitrificans (strain ATCC 33942 / OCh 114) TaxID=375451 RepID=Q16CK1_ROSDO|nr:hypothetical protein [Roseobacter denitrificans]ABG30292.1 hypothetical protein RD1_0591 [Roseobacter denitrificans OCh 114]
MASETDEQLPLVFINDVQRPERFFLVRPSLHEVLRPNMIMTFRWQMIAWTIIEPVR